MLLSSALGSLVSGRFKAPSSLSLVLAVLASALILYAVALPPALAAARGATIAARIGVTVAVIAPLGFLMGMPFPSGIRHAGARSKELVSWAWAVNGGASVFGSTLSVVISMARGFTATFVAGTLVYAVALVVITLLARQTAPLAPEPTP
jgi:hypothetical protein